MGWASSNGMGATPLSFTEIDAYNRSTYSFLNAEEVLLIRKMSASYVSESSDRNPRKQAPFGTYQVKSNSFVNALMAIAKKA